MFNSYGCELVLAICDHQCQITTWLCLVYNTAAARGNMVTQLHAQALMCFHIPHSMIETIYL